MSDDRNAETVGLCLDRQGLHFIQYSPLKVTEVFAVRRRQERIFRNPAARIRFIASFNLCPRKTFPLTKVDLTKWRPHMAVDTKCLGNCPSSCMGPPQVAGVDHADVFRQHSIDEFSKLGSATCIQFWIGLAAKSSGHVCLRMANEQEFAHTIHTPQK